jgi:hypothetical protein
MRTDDQTERQKNRQTDRHEGANVRYSQFCKNAFKVRYLLKFFGISNARPGNCCTNSRSQNFNFPLLFFLTCSVSSAVRVTLQMSTSSLLFGLADFNPRLDMYYLTVEFLFQFLSLISTSGSFYSVL